MTKFKVGDIVVGNQDNEFNGVEQGQLYQVLATELDHGWDYVKTDLSLGGWVLSERFDLYKAASQVEQDDPLPPAPESVRYNDEYYDRSAYKQTWLDVKQDPNQIYIETGQYGEYKGVGIVLSPDAALQLAHDLNRMANEIKRKGKRQERKTTLSPAIAHPYGE